MRTLHIPGGSCEAAAAGSMARGYLARSQKYPDLLHETRARLRTLLKLQADRQDVKLLQAA